jgi:hypothetical protein
METRLADGRGRTVLRIMRESHRAGALLALSAFLSCVVTLSHLGSSTAFAAVSSGDGPGGTLTVGAGSGATGAGAPGATGGGSSGGGSNPWTCTYTPLTLNDESQAPGGPTPGAWFSVTCVDRSTGAETTQTEWISDQATPGAPSVDPYSLALQAEKSIVLPDPVIDTDPPGTSVVNLPTWLWVNSDIWHEYQVTASAGPVSATASAVPTSVAWSMGDGGSVTCAGPGDPYDPALPSAVQATDCSYTYGISSAGQPSADGNPDDGAFLVTATISWSVSWSAQGAAGGGSLPPLTTSSTTVLRVEQVESVDSSLVIPLCTGCAGRTKTASRASATKGVRDWWPA